METQNQNTRYLILGVLALIIVGAIIVTIVLNSDSDETPSADNNAATPEQTTQNTPSVEDVPSEASTPTTVPPQESSVDTPNIPDATDTPDTTPSASSAEYKEYTEQAFNQAIQDNKKIVLFFHANWCPTCRALDEEITSGLSRVPADTTILKVDYDNSGGLTQTYKITYQHTMVLLQGSRTQPGNTWQGGGLDELIFQVKSI